MSIDPRPVIGFCWLAFLIAWAIFAMTFGGSGKRRTTASGLGLRLAMLAGAFLSVRYGDVFRPFGTYAGAVAQAGAALCILGLAFAIWARVSLGRSWGMPMTLHDDPELVTSGAYRYVRHPIYTGMGAMLIGTALVFPVAALPCALMIVYTVYAARREERDMEQRFPGAYPEYTRRSKFLVPFLF